MAQADHDDSDAVKPAPQLRPNRPPRKPTGGKPRKDGTPKAPPSANWMTFAASKDPMTGLNPIEETFAVLVAGGRSMVDALAEADPQRAAVVKDKSLREYAYILGRKPEVQDRITVLRYQLRRESAYTMERAMAEAAEAMEHAREAGNPSAFVAAVQLRAKITGLLVEDRKNSRRPLQDVPEEELLARLAEAEREIEQAQTLH